MHTAEQHPETERPADTRGVFLLLGPAGSGKGTVARRLLEDRITIRHLSMGDLLRAAVDGASRDGTHARQLAARLAGCYPHPDPLGEIRRCLASGLLIPNAWTQLLIEQALAAPELRAGRWSLDGYPRRVGAARHLLGALRARDIPVLRVLHLQLGADEVRRRLLARGRADDTPRSIDSRLDVYEHEVRPTIAWLREHLPLGTVTDVDAHTPGLTRAAGEAELQRRALAAVVSTSLHAAENSTLNGS